MKLTIRVIYMGDRVELVDVLSGYVIVLRNEEPEQREVLRLLHGAEVVVPTE